MTESTAQPTAGRALPPSPPACLLFASVAAELVRPVQRPDGTVTNLPGFALYLIAWTAGALALVVALHGLGGVGSAAGPLPRSGRIGRAVALAGAALLVGFGAIGLGSALVTGAPAEWSFLLFAVGLLLMVVAAVPLALGLRRAGGLGGWWGAVLVARRRRPGRARCRHRPVARPRPVPLLRRLDRPGPAAAPHRPGPARARTGRLTRPGPGDDPGRSGPRSPSRRESSGASVVGPGPRPPRRIR